jgi:hypothetical protein
MPAPISLSGDRVDLSPRVVQTQAITGSPAAAAETIVATLPALGDIAAQLGVWLSGSIAFTVGTSGTAFTLRVRRTNVAGTVVFTTGALTATAANLVAPGFNAFDPITVAGLTLPGQVYVVTLQVTAGSAASTVSAASVVAVCI